MRDMSDENKTTLSETTDVQSKNEESTVGGESSDKSEAFVASMKKKMSKVKSKFGATKSTMSTAARRRKQQQEAPPPSPLVDPIVVPAVSVGDLKDRYYRDLRLLLPPPDLGDSHQWPVGVVTEKLRHLHDAIDEIDQMLDGINLSLFDHDVIAARAPETAEHRDLVSCANLPLSDSLSKPDAGIKMKAYRLRTKQERPKSTKPATAQVSRTAVTELVQFTNTSVPCNDKP